MMILAALEDIKRTLCDERSELLQKRQKLSEDLKKGNDFFNTSQQYSKMELAKATARMRQIVRELSAVDKQLFDLDIMIGVKFETILTDCQVRIDAAGRKNDMGEITSNSSFLIDSFADGEKTEITPEDLWILKIIKPTLKYCNVEVIPKQK